MPAPRKAFTLIELLVVVSVIALLIGIILPALGSARRSASAAVCLAGLRESATGLVAYSGDNQDKVIPSYTMTGVTGTAGPLEGWAPILDKGGYIQTSERTDRSVFYCPDTVDVEGVASGQTGTDPNNPKGWQDWPWLRTGTSAVAVTIPERGFNKILRVSYWINADNPIGAAAVVTPNLFYTGSVGYGPGTNGKKIFATPFSAFARPSNLIALADGLYAGRQRDNRLGVLNSRIGYRHGPRGKPAANAAFADGHCETLGSKDFPRAAGGSNVLAEVQAENAHGRPTVYADPEKALGM